MGQLFCTECGTKIVLGDTIEQRAEVDELRKKFEGARAMHDSLFRDFTSLKREYQNINLEKSNLSSELRNSNAELKKVIEAYRTLEASFKEKSEKLGSIEQQYQALQSKEAQVSKAYNELLPKYNDAIKERDIYRKGIADRKKDQEEIAKLRSLIKTYEGLQVRYNELDQAHNAVLAERDGLRVELENSKGIYDEEHRKYASLEQENRALLETYAELSRKNEDTEKELENLKSEHEGKKQAIRDLELRIKVTSEKLNETERQHRDLLLQHLELTSSYERLLGAAKQAMREREQIKVSSKAGADHQGEPKETTGQEVKPEGLKTIIRTNPEKKED